MPLKPSGVFVTGTDTGVGKTLVSVSLVHALVNHGLRVAVMKPIASGSDRTPDGLRNADALALAGASNVRSGYESINPYCFAPAISPHIAAEEADIEVKFSLIQSRYEALADNADFVVVEGAGGWHAPVTAAQTMANLAKSLHLPVLLVVGLRLGCLNHASLTKLAINASGVDLAGWVANSIDPTLERAAENLSSLVRILGSEPLAVFPFSPEIGQATPSAPTAPSVSPLPPHVLCGEQIGRRLSLISF